MLIPMQLQPLAQMAWASAFERRPLTQLLEQHQETISFLRQELGDSLDDTALLR